MEWSAKLEAGSVPGRVFYSDGHGKAGSRDSEASSATEGHAFCNQIVSRSAVARAFLLTQEVGEGKERRGMGGRRSELKVTTHCS